MQRCALFVLLGIIFPAMAEPITHLDQAMNKVLHSIKKHEKLLLKGTPTECVFPAEAETIQDGRFDNVFVINGHEVHNEKCSGDPDVALRRFTYTVNKDTGALTCVAWALAEKHKEEWTGKQYPVD